MLDDTTPVNQQGEQAPVEPEATPAEVQGKAATPAEAEPAV